MPRSIGRDDRREKPSQGFWKPWSRKRRFLTYTGGCDIIKTVNGGSRIGERAKSSSFWLWCGGAQKDANVQKGSVKSDSVAKEAERAVSVPSSPGQATGDEQEKGSMGSGKKERIGAARRNGRFPTASGRVGRVILVFLAWSRQQSPLSSSSDSVTDSHWRDVVDCQDGRTRRVHTHTHRQAANGFWPWHDTHHHLARALVFVSLPTHTQQASLQLAGSPVQLISVSHARVDKDRVVRDHSS